MLNTAALDELYRKVLHQEALRPPAHCDMAYLMGQARPNQDSVLHRAPDFNTPRIGFIGHDNTEQACGYTGYSNWKQKLLALGVEPHRIVGIEGSFVEVGGRQIIHTLSELEAMVRYAARERLQTVTVVAPYWHLTRSFMTAVLAAKRHYPSLKLYPALGAPLPWDEESVHSQGTSAGIRADFMFQETTRLFAYHEQGNLPSAEDVLDYIEQRDA